MSNSIHSIRVPIQNPDSFQVFYLLDFSIFANLGEISQEQPPQRLWQNEKWSAHRQLDLIGSVELCCIVELSSRVILPTFVQPPICYACLCLFLCGNWVLFPVCSLFSLVCISLPISAGFCRLLPASAGFCLVGQRLWKWLRRRTTLPVFEEAHGLCVWAWNCRCQPWKQNNRCHGLSYYVAMSVYYVTKKKHPVDTALPNGIWPTCCVHVDHQSHHVAGCELWPSAAFPSGNSKYNLTMNLAETIT